MTFTVGEGAISKRLVFAVIAALGLALAVYFGWRLHETRWYGGYLPPQLETRGLVRHDGFGSAVFDMTPETVEAVRRGGAAFLSTARQGRGHENPGEADRFALSEWSPTPVDDKMMEGLLMGGNGLSKDLSRSILAAAARPGSFLAEGRDNRLIVLPDLGLIVFIYWD